MITLKNINADNWYACTLLEAAEEQKKLFPAPAVFWLAEAAYCEMNACALYAGEEIVGFAVYAIDPEDGNYWIMAFMIDHRQQGKGYGRFGMLAVVEHIREQHGCKVILLGHRPNNDRAARLYASLGFKEVDRTEYEVIRQLSLA
ncbi:GNAT family N-acetyltransferase [Paenibacillus glycanilyticus]|uniref:GNAT family N-acetyltransferase n=1 Tax=Paenibacillus glycanilyticus TaxID=126569 RepID=UPI00203FA8E7|nr:GNAT family N-acetyltransferase [Paenibacillus glycanilyticus]MCM3629572.1 GNAT family N-acetyltransferase [Paenibacillus glycanilyticus]